MKARKEGPHRLWGDRGGLALSEVPAQGSQQQSEHFSCHHTPSTVTSLSPSGTAAWVSQLLPFTDAVTLECYLYSHSLTSPVMKGQLDSHPELSQGQSMSHSLPINKFLLQGDPSLSPTAVTLSLPSINGTPCCFWLLHCP